MAEIRIGERVRRRRLLAKLSQQVVADRVGVDRTYLSKIENGSAALDRRSTVEKLAVALGCSYGDLTGQPIEATTPEIQQATSGVNKVRDAFYGSSLEDGADARPRPLAAIRVDVEASADAWQECDYVRAGNGLGAILAELHAAATGVEREQALRLLVSALDTAAWTSRVLGHYDLAHAISGRELEAAQRLEDRGLIGWAVFTRALMTIAAAPQSGQRLAQRMLDTAIDALRPVAEGESLEVLGMLHLAAARTRVDAEYIGEASQIAGRSGEGSAHRLYFGPTNVNIWRVHLAVESGEGGRVAEISRGVDVASIPSRARRAMYFRHVGIGYAQDGKPADATKALLRAERAAPGKLRLDPLAKDTIGHLVDRARASAVSPDLTKLAGMAGVQL